MKIWGNYSCLTKGENLIKYGSSHEVALVLYADIFESVIYTNPLIQPFNYTLNYYPYSLMYNLKTNQKNPWISSSLDVFNFSKFKCLFYAANS